MSKKTYIFLASVTGLLILALSVMYLYIKHQEFLAQRHHLVCEILKPGMSKEEVLSILRQTGDFTMSEADWLGGNIALDIYFVDPKVKEQYGFFSLEFNEYKYVSATIKRGLEHSEFICNFYQPTQPVTETPKP